MSEKQVPTGAGTVDSPLDTPKEGLSVSSNWVNPNPLAQSRVNLGTKPAPHKQIRADVTVQSVS